MPRPNLIVLLLAVLAAPAAVMAADAEPVSEALFRVNNVWMMVAIFLVFIMHLGFATLESGLTRAKNTTNILFKNIAILSIGILTYALMGFAVMYPGEEFAGKVFGFSSAGWGLPLPSGGEGMEYSGGNYTYWTDFLFQAMFAATCATIVSGAVAERVKLSSFLIFTILFVAIAYPIAGMWKWGGGWLDAMGFYDFAGSTLVHSVGGWGALAGTIMLGPRLGKYVKGSIRPIMGHNMPLATIGVFLLWLGWFGFNGGSVLSAAAGDTSRVLVTTNIAAAGGVVAAMFISWIIQRKPDLSMALNGALAGLVGITAAADVVSPNQAAVIGFIAGALVVLSVIALDKIRIDDPVGAISVHLTCGIWGTLAVGIFSSNPDHTILTQLKGIGAIGAFAFVFAIVVFGVLKATMGLRVSADEEQRGLDLSEHDQEAYAGFQIFVTQ